MNNFFVSLVQSVIDCIKNRHQHIILIAGADISTNVNRRKVSPFAFALQKKWADEKVNSKIVIRTAIENKDHGYDLSIEPLLSFFTKIKINQQTVWKLILTLLKPKTMVVIDWDLNLNRACNKKKIKLFYLQHGVIVADHMYFGEHALKDLTVRDLPYGFLSWNDDSAQNFKQLCKTFITGNQWNNAFLNKGFLRAFKNEEANSILNATDQPVILFTLTWGSHHKSFMPDTMINVIKQTTNDYLWIIRLHPVIFMRRESLDEFELFLKQNFTAGELEKILWKEFNALPLPLILLRTQVHITIESSVVIEAAQFGITSLVLNSNVIRYGPNGENTPPYGGPSYFKTERKKGYVQVYAPGLNIAGWIASQTKKDQLIDLEKNEKEWIKFMQDINTPYNIHLN